MDHVRILSRPKWLAASEHGSPIAIDAERAYTRLVGQVAAACADASSEAQLLGNVATQRYRHALEASAVGPAPPFLWTRFIQAVLALVRELGRSRPWHSAAARTAREALDRLVFENLDLIERRPAC
jgi:hypothetical protein